MKKISRYITFLFLMIGTVHSQTQVPECYNNYTPIAGHGVKNDHEVQGPRIILNVYVDPSLGGNVSAAVEIATNEWNAARSSTGAEPPYWFNIVPEPYDADIKIVPGTTAHGCANYVRATQEMTLDTGLTDNSTRIDSRCCRS